MSFGSYLIQSVAEKGLLNHFYASLDFCWGRNCRYEKVPKAKEDEESRGRMLKLR